MTPVNKPYVLLPNEVEARRAGGSIIHVLSLNEDGKAERLAKAICGDGPKEGYTSSFTRAGWYGVTSQVSCPKCLKILAVREAV